MAAKRLLFRSAARQKVLSGAAALADAVRITPGPKSKCVLIQKKWGKPIVCNGGITIAKEVELEDPEANLGAQLIREAAERTGEAVGDGISTSAILAHAIFAEGLHNVAAGASAVDWKRGLDRGLLLPYEAGIIDPTKVVRVGLENAVSVASGLLLVQATLTELPEDKKKGATGHEELE